MQGPRFITARVITDGDMSGAITSSELKSESLDKVNVHIAWAGVTGTGSSITVEGTVDGSIWHDVGVTEPTISGASGNGFVIVTENLMCWKSIRVSYAAGSVSAGTLQCWIHAKTA